MTYASDAPPRHNKRRRYIARLLPVVIVVLAVWVIANPRERFGWCCYALTTYNTIPRPIADYQVRSDGKVRTVSKTHSISLATVEWLLESRPQVLIIGTGWDGVAKTDATIAHIEDCQVRVLKTSEAIKLFNQLKSAGSAVSIHLHSTC